MSHTPSAASGTAQRRRRTTSIVVVVVVAILAFAGGVIVARLGGNDAAEPSPVPSTPSPTPTASATAPSDTSSVTIAPPDAPLPDGRHFGLLKAVEPAPGGSPTLAFDLAYWYTGDEANQVAASRGDETPVPNDYYIVNDNPKVRTLTISPSVDVRYIPEGRCCDLQAGTLDDLAAAVNGAATTDYPDMSYTYWWVTLSGGEVVTIEQQYLP